MLKRIFRDFSRKGGAPPGRGRGSGGRCSFWAPGCDGRLGRAAGVPNAACNFPRPGNPDVPPCGRATQNMSFARTHVGTFCNFAFSKTGRSHARGTCTHRRAARRTAEEQTPRRGIPQGRLLGAPRSPARSPVPRAAAAGPSPLPQARGAPRRGPRCSGCAGAVRGHEAFTERVEKQLSWWLDGEAVGGPLGGVPPGALPARPP